MFPKVRSATFAILDGDGLPVCCGIFVSACGVALTAAHEAGKTFRKRGSRKKPVLMARGATHDDEEFDLEVVERNLDGLGIAVLRLLPAPAPAAPQWLPVPEGTFTDDELSGAPLNLLNSCIAWSVGCSPSNFAQGLGSVIASSPTKLLYNVGTFRGQVGVALLIRGKHVIGLHSEAFVLRLESDASPSHAAEAVRLDLPAVRKAVERCVRGEQSSGED